LFCHVKQLYLTSSFNRITGAIFYSLSLLNCGKINLCLEYKNSVRLVLVQPFHFFLIVSSTPGVPRPMIDPEVWVPFDRQEPVECATAVDVGSLGITGRYF